MKRFLILIISIFMLTSLSAQAKTLKMVVTTMNDFSTQNSTQEAEFSIVDNYKISDERHIQDGTTVKGEIVSVVEPKRGKRNGYAYIRITSYKIPGGKETPVENPNVIVKISEYKPINIVDKGLDLGVSAAGFVVKNISYPINFARGVITADEGENRLKAGAKMTYDKSVFSYTSKGENLEVPAGEKLIMTVKYKTSTDNDDNDKNDDE